MIKKTLIALFTFLSLACSAQEKAPFYNEIQAYKKRDAEEKLPKNAILFTGSSSFRLWDQVEESFPAYPILNRAFGGATLPDVIRYVNDVVIPYKPKQILIYCGDNDLASRETVTPDTVLNNFKTFFELVRAKLPNTSIVYVAIKPSPSRAHLMPKIEETNDKIKAFLKTKKKTGFVDVYHKMLTKDGAPVKELFKPDMLHMNDKGYAIWIAAIQPYLAK